MRQKCNRSNAWDAWQWRKYLWLAVHDEGITLRVIKREGEIPPGRKHRV